MTADVYSVYVKDANPAPDTWTLWSSVCYLPLAETIALMLQAERPTSQIVIRKTA